jgi:vacuolar protein sorting-associated protein 35
LQDTIAQEYLMDCVIQVFPDEFHLATLEVFLTACGQLQPSVNLNKIIIALMNRLSNFAQESADSIPADMELFPLFNSNCANIIKSKENMLLEDTLAMQVALANFATKVYPSHLDYVDSILNFSAQCVQRAPKMDSKCVALVSRLLTGPLETLPALAVLDLQGYAPLLSLLPFDARKSIAVEILKAELKVREPLSSVERVDKFLDLVRPLIKDESDTAPLSDDTRFEFESEQNLVSRLVHLVHSDDTDEQYRLLLAARKHFGQGGPTRIAYTLVPLVFSALNLAKRAHDREANVRLELVYTFLIGSIFLIFGSAICCCRCRATRLASHPRRSCSSCIRSLPHSTNRFPAFACVSFSMYALVFIFGFLSVWFFHLWIGCYTRLLTRPTIASSRRSSTSSWRRPF